MNDSANDTALDDRINDRLGLVVASTATPSERTRAALVELGLDAAGQVRSERVTPARNPFRGARRRVWIGAAAIAGAAIVLTAGTTATAYYLSVPPFVTLGDHSVRASESIPMDYTSRNGIEIRCRIFLEFQNVPTAQVDTVSTAIKAKDWSNFGQSLYDAQGRLPDAPPLRESLSPQDAVEKAELPAVYDFARSVIPGLRLFDGGDRKPALGSVIETCVPSAQ